jgi:hypothetical protein
MEQGSHDLMKQSVGLRLDNITQLGVINKPTKINRKSKIKPFTEWTEQERRTRVYVMRYFKKW